MFEVKSTGAIATVHSAVALLNHYISINQLNIMSDQLTRLSDYFVLARPRGNVDRFRAYLSFPTKKHGLVKVRSTIEKSKVRAKRHAALCAVKNLFYLQELDDFLLPIPTTKSELIFNKVKDAHDYNKGGLGRDYLADFPDAYKPTDVLAKEMNKLMEEKARQIFDGGLEGGGEEVEVEKRGEGGEGTGKKEVENENKTPGTQKNENPIELHVPTYSRMRLLGPNSIPLAETNETNSTAHVASKTNESTKKTGLCKIPVGTVALSYKNLVVVGGITPFTGYRELYISVLEIKECEQEADFLAFDDASARRDMRFRKLCIMTRNPAFDISMFRVYLGEANEPLDCKFYTCGDTTTRVAHEQLDQIAKFTITLTSSVVNKRFAAAEEQFPYFIIPLLPNDACPEPPTPDNVLEKIDWREIERACNNEPVLRDPISQYNDLSDSIVVDVSNKRSFRFYVEHVYHNAGPDTSLGEIINHADDPTETFRQYYARVAGMTVSRPGQPILRGKKVVKAVSGLKVRQPADENEDDDEKAKEDEGSETEAPENIPISHRSVYLIPEFCKRYRFSSSVYRAGLLLPTVFPRVDAALKALDVARRRFSLPVSDLLILEATCATSFALDFDYERLELLGDAFLKCAAGTYNFIKHPEANEETLHHCNARLICNKSLYNIARDMKLEQKISVERKSRRLWIPPYFSVYTANGMSSLGSNTQNMPDKLLAECN